MGSICGWCNEEMSNMEIETCKGNVFVEYPDGLKLVSSNYHFSEPSGRCHDCNIKHGGKHHPGCDVERCPKCEGQLISCGCLES